MCASQRALSGLKTQRENLRGAQQAARTHSTGSLRTRSGVRGNDELGGYDSVVLVQRSPRLAGPLLNPEALTPARSVIPNNCETHASKSNSLHSVHVLYYTQNKSVNPYPGRLGAPGLLRGRRWRRFSTNICSSPASRASLPHQSPRFTMTATWLILPVVICLSQRLSHACLSISIYTAKLQTAH